MVYKIQELNGDKFILIEAENISEALDEFGGVDRVMNSAEIVDNEETGLFAVYQFGQNKPEKIIHSFRTFSGFGYHGGGRKKLDESKKKKFKTMSISGTPEEIEKLKEIANKAGKSVSRLVLDTFL